MRFVANAINFTLDYDSIVWYSNKKNIKLSSESNVLFKLSLVHDILCVFYLKKSIFIENVHTIALS